jgi:hypothetical protein
VIKKKASFSVDGSSFWIQSSWPFKLPACSFVIQSLGPASLGQIYAKAETTFSSIILRRLSINRKIPK